MNTTPRKWLSDKSALRPKSVSALCASVTASANTRAEIPSAGAEASAGRVKRPSPLAQLAAWLGAAPSLAGAGSLAGAEPAEAGDSTR